MFSEIMKLKDGTEISLVGGAFIDDLVHVAESEEAAINVCNKFRPENTTMVSFYHEGDTSPYKSYQNLILVTQPSRQNEVNEYNNPTGNVIVRIQLRKQTEIEQRIARLESAQTDVELALTELYESIGG